MRKAIALCVSLVLLLLTFSGCSDEETYGISTEEELLVSEFSLPFYDKDIESRESKLSDKEIEAILSEVPADQYESYPDQHNIPLTATLYKDGEEITVDIRDRRLIRMLNFYNNAVYHCRHAYSQGSLDPESLQEVESESFRLVLTYAPQEGDSWGTLYDTIIVTNESFVGICHDIPYGDGTYPSTAFSHQPLYRDYSWLDLFGF